MPSFIKGQSQFGSGDLTELSHRSKPNIIYDYRMAEQPPPAKKQKARSIVKQPSGSSCHACRLAKVRCIGGNPCPRCKRRSANCIYDNDQVTKMNTPIIKQRLAVILSSLSVNQQNLTYFSQSLDRFNSQLRELESGIPKHKLALLKVPAEYPIGTSADPMDLGLPPITLRDELLDLYFEHCWAHNPIIIPSIFKIKLANHDIVSPAWGDVEWMDFYVLMFMMMAVASKSTANPEFSKGPNAAQMQGARFVRVAHALLERCQNNPTINLVQALLMMCTYEHTAPKRFRSLLFAGMAIRCMFKLGLHNQPDEPNLSLLEKKERQVAFWICVMRDVESSLNLQAPYKVDIDKCSVPMLTVHDMDDDKGGFQWLICTIKLLKIARQFWEIPDDDRELRKISLKDVVDLERLMTEWLQDLPPDLQYRGGAERSGDCMRLHVNFFFIKMITYQMFAHKLMADSTIVEEDILFVYEQCVLAAHAITQLYLEGDISWPFWHNFHYVAILQCLDMHVRDVRVAVRRGTGVKDAFAWFTKTTHLMCESLHERALMDHDEAMLIFDDVLRFWGVVAKLTETPAHDDNDTMHLLQTCFPRESDRKYIVISVDATTQAQERGANQASKSSNIPTERDYLNMTRRFVKLSTEEEALAKAEGF
ncbi:hypothetical protein INT43_006177 [Umbelopsis isabellina]|uniref:Zn(2)-C6 fungal-type domain-containing protein n=1 Tax=Mortierella isabellina TaxID=91625 RepID=A0A8H7PZK7_MORIS|nr:hypothetical protein INT43_006177 [Umbelopsis isabellina]